VAPWVLEDVLAASAAAAELRDDRGGGSGGQSGGGAVGGGVALSSAAVAVQVSHFLAWIGSRCLGNCVHGAPVGAALSGGGGGGAGAGDGVHGAAVRPCRRTAL
jgi:hypothetical protein